MLALSAFTSFLLDADIAGRRAPEPRRVTSRSDIWHPGDRNCEQFSLRGTHYAIYHR